MYINLLSHKPKSWSKFYFKRWMGETWTTSSTVKIAFTATWWEEGLKIRPNTHLSWAEYQNLETFRFQLFQLLHKNWEPISETFGCSTIFQLPQPPQPQHIWVPGRPFNSVPTANLNWSPGDCFSFNNSNVKFTSSFCLMAPVSLVAWWQLGRPQVAVGVHPKIDGKPSI